MKPAKIIGFLCILVFFYLTFWNDNATLSPLLSILKESGNNVSAVFLVLRTVPPAALLLNIGFVFWMFVLADKNKEIKHSTFIALLLLIIPLAIVYLSILLLNYNIYNLASIPG